MIVECLSHIAHESNRKFAIVYCIFVTFQFCFVFFSRTSNEALITFTFISIVICRWNIDCDIRNITLYIFSNMPIKLWNFCAGLYFLMLKSCFFPAYSMNVFENDKFTSDNQLLRSYNGFFVHENFKWKSIEEVRKGDWKSAKGVAQQSTQSLTSITIISQMLKQLQSTEWYFLLHGLPTNCLRMSQFRGSVEVDIIR